MKRSYLARVYVSDKRLFFFIAGFAGLTLVCNLAGHEVTPFFVWGMYSRHEKVVDQYEVPVTMLDDGSRVDASAGYTDNTRFFLNSPLAAYMSIRENGGVDLQGHGLHGFGPLKNRLFNGVFEFGAFPEWYGRYVSEVTGRSGIGGAIEVKRVHYDDNQHIIVDSSYLLTTWSQH
jgi:hypothetical protein